MKLRNLLISGLILTLFIGIGCKKTEYKNTPISANWLLPLIKGNITPLKLTTLKDMAFQFSVTGDDIGLSTTLPSSNPAPQTYHDAGSYELDLNDLVQAVKLDTCLIEVTVTNHFQVTVKAGSKVSVRNVGSSTILGSFMLSGDLGSEQSQTFEIDLSDQTVSSSLEFTLDELTLGPYSNETFTESIDFDVNFKNVSIQHFEIATNQSYDIRDTTKFDNSLIDFNDDNDKIGDSTVHATIRFTSKNELPLNMIFQIYFLDTSYHIIDSLFTPTASISGAEYTGGEYVNAKESEFETTLDKSRIEQIKNAKHIIYRLHFDSDGYPGSFIRVTNDERLLLKAVGDIRIVLSSDLF